MTEVTRIACPGCHSLLRFEPEALDFPANCGACEGRFTAGIYVRVSCPKCHCGSKIRESYRGQRVRCVRCRHDFVADEGIAPGGGGLLLVARLLDTDLEVPPETIQPFLGHVRSEAGRDQPPPAVDRVVEAERLLAEAVADRDRLAEEVGLFKAILARMVATQPNPEPSPTALLAAPDAGEAEAKLAGLVEERDRFELLARGLEADLDRARAEAESARRSAREAQARAADLEERLDRAVREVLEAEEETCRLVDDHADALDAGAREHSTLQARASRLDRAARSALAGEAEALARLGEFVNRSAEDSSSVAAELDRERARGRELSRIADEAKAELEAARQAEAERSAGLDGERRGLDEERLALLERLDRERAEAEDGHRSDRDQLVARLAESEQARLELSAQVERLTGEVEAGHGAGRDRLDASEQARLELTRQLEQFKADVEAGRQSARDHLAASERDRLELSAQLGRLKSEFEEQYRADRDRLAESLAGSEQARLGLAAQFERFKAEVEAAHRAERDRLSASMAGSEQARLALSTRFDNERRRHEEERLGLLERFDREWIEAEAAHRAERDQLAASLADSEHARLELSARVEQIRVEAARSAEAEVGGDPSPDVLAEQERLVAELESVRVDSRRRLRAQNTLFERLKQEFDKLAAENNALGERVRRLAAAGPPLADPAGWSIVASSTVPTLADALASEAKGLAEHRDIAVTMLYDDDEPGGDDDDFPAIG